MRTIKPNEQGTLAKLIEDGDNTLPFSELFTELADKMAEEAQKALTEGKLPSQDIAGMIAMASQLRSCAEGKLTPREIHSTLKAYSEKKTPAPEKKTEERQILDINTVFAQIAEDSPGIIRRMTEEAIAAREAIQQRLGTDATLTLRREGEEPEKEEELSFEEPEEIRLLRRTPLVSEREVE